jgi:hypothetical protein
MGFAMGKDDNIYVKLVLDVHFDKNAPNFHWDKDMISWCPTVEEIGFINDSIQKISQHYWNATDATKNYSTPPSKPEFPPAPTPTTNQTTTSTPPTPKFTPPPTPTPTTEKTKSSQAASTTHDSTVDLLLKRKKGEKEQKVAFTP